MHVYSFTPWIYNKFDRSIDLIDRNITLALSALFRYRAYRLKFSPVSFDKIFSFILIIHQFTTTGPMIINGRYLKMNCIYSALVKRSAIVLVLMASFFYSFGQQPLSFSRITVDNGLPQNTVMTIMQDKTGFIWFGTNDGLCKYNGIDFKIYKHTLDDEGSLGNNQINKVYEDHKGNIWVGTFNGLNLYNRNNDTFVRCLFPGKKTRYNIQTILEDQHGNLWIGCQKGLYLLSASDIASKKTILKKSSITDLSVQSLMMDDRKRLWLGGKHGLTIFDPVSHQTISLNVIIKQWPGIEGEIKVMVRDSKNNYWIGTESMGLFSLNLNTGTYKHYTQNTGLSSNTVRTVSEGVDGNIWIGTKTGLNILHPITSAIQKYFSIAQEPHSLSKNSIRSIIQDNEGNVWLGTYNGGVSVTYKNDKVFNKLEEKAWNKPGLDGGVVNTMTQETDGSFWIGTDDGGLNQISEDLKHINSFYPGDRKSEMNAMNAIKALADNGNTIWVGTGSGLFLFDKKSHRFIRKDILEKPRNPELIQKFVFLKDGPVLWIATSYSGLYRIEREKVVKHYVWRKDQPNGLLYGPLTALAKTANKIWIGTQSEGISCLDIDNGNITNYIHEQPKGISDNGIVSLAAIGEDLWIGTKSGLEYFSQATKKSYKIGNREQSLDGTVYSMRLDYRKQLWISTNKGLYKLSFKYKGANFNPTNFSLSNYTVEDGLPSNEFAPNASLTARNGELMFGSIRGLVKFQPEQIKANRNIPNVVLTDFELLGKEVPSGKRSLTNGQNIEVLKKISLHYNNSTFSIRYAALNFINATKNTFAYKMEGPNGDDWHYIENQRVVTFSNLDPGNYRFQVKAANNDGIWNNAPKYLDIEILPPWWQTRYAYFGYFLLLIGLLYLYNMYTRHTAALKAQLRFQANSLQKDQELAQEKINFFMNVSHEIKTPLTLVLAPIDKLLQKRPDAVTLTQNLSLMQRNGERLLRMVNQMLGIQKFHEGEKSLKISKGNIASLIGEILVSFESLADLKRVNINYKHPEEEQIGWFDAEKLETILYNILSNAIKFSYYGGSVTIEGIIENSYPNRQLKLGITDRGCGITPDKLPLLFKRFYHQKTPDNNIEGSGLGLAYSKTLANLHHGDIAVESLPGTKDNPGHTTFWLRIPIDETAYSKDSIDTEQEIKESKNLKPDLSEGMRAEIVRQQGKEKLQMLIAEDNLELANFIKGCFSDLFEVIIESNGELAHQTALKVDPDIIISDVMMPGMSGIELCTALKSDIRTSHIPVILLTARDSLGSKIEGLETGADDYVTKPFEISLLDARVWNLIGSRQQLRLRYQKHFLLEPSQVIVGNIDQEFLSKALKIVEKYIDQPNFTVDELSAEMAMGRATFTRKIKALTNQTPLEFMRGIRLKRAFQLLSSGKYPVSEVAYMVGFMDINYFRKCYKELFNATPREHTSTSPHEK
jgi:ligand-binding sensor domain-containing protein/DNA-binding response OmpR family regulator